MTIHQVSDSKDAVFRSKPEAPVLLLGDSLSNIDSEPDLGWGAGAGFGAQLALRLGCDVDVIARDGGGATAVRQELARRADPFAGVTVLVWQVSVRDLAVEEWAPVPVIRKATATPRAAATLEKGQCLTVDVLPFDRAPKEYATLRNFDDLEDYGNPRLWAGSIQPPWQCRCRTRAFWRWRARPAPLSSPQP